MIMNSCTQSEVSRQRLRRDMAVIVIAYFVFIVRVGAADAREIPIT